MAVLDPRTRLISVRLSEGEHEQLKAVSRANRARSVSEFVRWTIAWLVSPVEPVEPAVGGARSLALLSIARHEALTRVVKHEGERERATGVDQRIDLLAREVIRLSQIIEAQPGPNPARAPVPGQNDGRRRPRRNTMPTTG